MDGGTLSAWMNTSGKPFLVRNSISLTFVHHHADRYLEKYHEMRVLYGQKLEADQKKQNYHERP